MNVRLRLFSIVVAALVLFAAGPASADLGIASGKLTLLRVHDVGTGYGPPGDEIDGEVIIAVDTKPGQAFGFALREDTNRAVRTGMLNLLRDAFANDWTIGFQYYYDPGDNNGRIFRLYLTRP